VTALADGLTTCEHKSIHTAPTYQEIHKNTRQCLNCSLTCARRLRARGVSAISTKLNARAEPSRHKVSPIDYSQTEFFFAIVETCRGKTSTSRHHLYKMSRETYDVLCVMKPT